MAGVNFKICGNKPPFNVELRKDSPTGILVNTMSVSTSGTCQTFTSLDYDTNYFLIANDSVSNSTSSGFTSCSEPPPPDIFLRTIETFNEPKSPEEMSIDYCTVCGTINYTPEMSSGQTYSLDLTYNQEITCTSNVIGSLSTVKIWTGTTEVFSNTISESGATSGVYSIYGITMDTPIYFETYSCSCADTTIEPSIFVSGTSTSSLRLSGIDDPINANFYIGTPDSK